MTSFVFQPEPDEQQLLAALAKQLEQGAALELSVVGQEKSVSVSPVLVAILQASLKQLSEGHAVTLLPNKRELSAQEAADLLGVSRPYLISNLLDGGFIPFRKVGTHRRIAMLDLLKYQANKEQQHALLDDIAADEQAEGMY